MPCPQEDPNSPCSEGPYAAQSDGDGWFLAAMMLLAFGTIVSVYVAELAEEKGTWKLR